MAEKKYLGTSSLALLWAKIKALIPTNNNQLVNGAGYQTASDVSTAIASAEKTYHIAYDTESSVGLAEVGVAKTGEPNYIPHGTVEYTMSNVSIPTLDDLSILWGYDNYVLTLQGVNAGGATTQVPVISSIDGFVGDGVKFVIEEDDNGD